MLRTVPTGNSPTITCARRAISTALHVLIAPLRAKPVLDQRVYQETHALRLAQARPIQIRMFARLVTTIALNALRPQRPAQLAKHLYSYLVTFVLRLAQTEPLVRMESARPVMLAALHAKETPTHANHVPLDLI